jgi:hypothetical protein
MAGAWLLPELAAEAKNLRTMPVFLFLLCL